jgi:hypothetical protein
MSRRNLIAETGIWFGTRGSEVQILSPRPYFSIRYGRFWLAKIPNVDENVAVGASKVNKWRLVDTLIQFLHRACWFKSTAPVMLNPSYCALGASCMAIVWRLEEYTGDTVKVAGELRVRQAPIGNAEAGVRGYSSHDNRSNLHDRRQ